MEWTVEEIADFLEHEMQSAFEVKDKDSLKRCVQMLARNTVGRREYEQETSGIRADIKTLSTEIRNLTENMREGFQQMEKRFEQVDKRFEQSDKRFDDLIHHMDKRFEQTDKRFDDLLHNMDKRFDDVNRRFNMMFAFITLGFTILAVLIKFVP